MHGGAVATFESCTRVERLRLFDIFHSLAEAPHQDGESQIKDETGRPNEVKDFGKWRVTFWADGATKELRIVRIEKLPSRRRIHRR